MNAFSRHPELGLELVTGRHRTGNAPTWIDGEAELSRSAEIVVNRKSVDDGAICGSENYLIVDERVCAAFCRELEQQGAALLRPAEVERLGAALFEHGQVSPAQGGRSAAAIASAAGIERPYPIRVLVAPLPLAALTGPFGREKRVPLLLLCVAQSDGHARSLCRRLGYTHVHDIRRFTRAPALPSSLQPQT